MLHRVGQGLLDQPEHGQLQAGGQVPGAAAALVPDRQAGRADPAEEIVEVGQAGQRLPELRPGAARSTPNRRRVSASACAGRCRDTSRMASAASAGARATAAQGAVRQGHDDGEVMGHAVVHLAGDPGSFHRRRQRAVLVAFALQPLARSRSAAR